MNVFGSNIFSEDGKVLFCLVCEKSVSAKKKYVHINTTQHKDRVKNTSKLNQQLITKQSCSSDTFSKIEEISVTLSLETHGVAKIPFDKLS